MIFITNGKDSQWSSPELLILVWVLQTFFGLKYFSKIKLNLKNQLFLCNFSSFLLSYIFWCLIKPFSNYDNSAFFFQFSVLRTDVQADLQIRPSYQTINSALDQNTKSKYNIIPSSSSSSSSSSLSSTTTTTSSIISIYVLVCWIAGLSILGPLLEEHDDRVQQPI